MFRVLAHLFEHHDAKLVGLALLVCASASVLVFHTFAHATGERGWWRACWVFLAGVSAGAGIWATHFVAMLAHRPGHGVEYDAILTIASLLVAIIIVTAGFALATRDTRLAAAAGGGVVGVGIAAMHFVGMQALIVPGAQQWHPPLVVASIAIGITLASAALVTRREVERRAALWLAPVLLVLAIIGMHFTAMRALTITPDPTVHVQGPLIDSATLAIAVAAVTSMAMLVVLAATLIISQSERRSLLRAQELVDAALEGLLLAKDGRVVNANQRLQTLTGRSAAELLGQRVLGDLLICDIDGQAGASASTQALLKTSSGRAITVEVVCRALRAGARADKVYAIRDLTERRMAEEVLRTQHETLRQREEELRTQNRRFEITLTNMPLGLCMIDPERRLAVCNERYADMYGLPPRLAQPGTHIAEIFAHRQRSGLYLPTADDEYRRTEPNTVLVAAEQIRHLGDGRVIRISRQPTGDGGWIAIHQDITERQRLDARLKEQNANLDIALANMSQGLAMYDAEERIVVANERYAEIYGLGPEHLKPGTPLRQIIEYRLSAGLYPGRTVEDVLSTTRELIARKTVNDVVSSPRPGCLLSVSIHPRPEGGWVVTVQDVTEREELNARLVRQNALLQEREAEINAQNARFNAAIGNILQGMCLYDENQRVVFANSRYAEIYGLTAEQVKPGTTLREIVEARVAAGSYCGDDPDAFIRDAMARFDNLASGILQLNDGRYISIVRRPMPGGGLVSTHEDITERQQLHALLEQQNGRLKAQEEELRTQNLRLDAALNNMGQGLAMYDDQQRLVICNPQYLKTYGLSVEQAKPGTPLREIIEHRIAIGEFRGRSADELLQDMRERVEGNTSVQYISHLMDGRHIAVSVQRMADGGTVTTHHDITEQRRTEAKIAHMALHDTLTELPNRVLLNERLEHALKRVKRGEIVATHLIDLDHFKTVNDTLGHPAGDKLLKMVADRLRMLVREADTVARMGGDEFAIIQSAIAQPADATALAHRVIEAVSQPYDIEGRQVVIGTSVGVAVGPLDGTSPDELIRNADLALYRAKGDGRGTYRFFEPEMDAQMQARRAIEDDLRGALPNGEFVLHYQPIVNLASECICGFEALMRWKHPEKGTVPPDLFIPLAEEIGFIVPLGEWALREACAAAVTWPGDLKIAVNLSPAQFRTPGLVQIVLGALAASGLPAERLELEITETILLQDSEATLSTLYQLRALGVRIAMDDFGTGYSSLSYLQSFPFDKIKIDRSFVRDIADGVGSFNIVRAVAAMASGFGMATTAEGVETREQLETVRAAGCTEMQGFVFSRPMPVEEVAGFLSRQAHEAGVGSDDAPAKAGAKAAADAA